MVTREQQQKLESFRHLFLTLTDDNTYSYTDQHRLYRFCQRYGLDWNQARRYVHDEACALLVRILSTTQFCSPFSADELVTLERWQRRLVLSVEDVQHVLAAVLPHQEAPPARQPKERAQPLTVGMLRSIIAKLPTQKL